MAARIQIDGQDDHACAGLLGSLEHHPCRRPLAGRVELEPDGLAAGRDDILDGGRRHVRQDLQVLPRAGGPGRGEFGLRMKRGLAADRRQHDRRREFFVEQLCLEADAARVDHAHRPQVDVAERAPVGDQRLVAVRAGREVAVVRRRQLVLCHGVEVEDVQGVVGRVDQEVGKLDQVERLLGQYAPGGRAGDQRAGGEKLQKTSSCYGFQSALLSTRRCAVEP